ncbi:MAG: hypothetical protein SVP26_00220 [Chloroflexota bacterium]|nr:hypothetical protein [Chloroflexota bacterium]
MGNSVAARLMPAIALAALVCALALPILTAAPASGNPDVQVYFRVMGPVDRTTFPETGEYQVIWADYVTVPADVYITCQSGTQYHLYVNSSDRYIVERTSDGYTWDRGSADDAIGATSVLAALEQASQQGGFSYKVLDNWFPGMGFFISSIANYDGIGAVGWGYRVWNPGCALQPSISSDMFLLGYDTMPLDLPHEQVLWFWGGTSGCYPLKVTTDKATAGVGEEFTATVQYYREQGWSGTGSWYTLGGATIEMGGETFVSDGNGQATLYAESENTYQLSASKPFDGNSYYVPSDSRTEVTVSGGDTSEWWTQTTQADFAGCTLTQVDTSSSPGDALLARGGAVTDDYVLDGGTDTLGGEHFYDQFKVINGATLSVPQGEVLRVHANYIEVDSTSSIDADGKGSVAGGGTADNGEDGFGMGGASGGMHAGSYGGGGGGAGHNKDGGDGSYGTTSDAAGGAGGYKYGQICRTGDDTFFLGSSGAGGAGDGGNAGGDGGYGGGAVVLESMDTTGTDPTVVINGTITADGEDGGNGSGAGCGGGGGGSGGTILIKSKNMTIADGALSVEAGHGGDGGTGGGGGGGGTGGHIKVFYETCNDSPNHLTSRGNGGAGDPDPGEDGQNGSGSRSSYWYSYVAHGETYSPVLPFHASGTIVSPSYDTGYADADFVKLQWCATGASGTQMKFQIATNDDNATWDFKGPDGTAGTYYTVSGGDLWAGHDGDRYVRYKAFLSTTQPGNTPVLNKVGVTYTTGGTPDIISFTVTDNGGGAGLCFGAVDPGTDDNPDDGQGAGAGAVTLTVGSETNVDCTIQVCGDDFECAAVFITIGNAKWDTDSSVAGATAMTSDYTTDIGYSTAYAEWSQDVWHWLSVPGAQPAGTYTSTFYYRAVKR